MEKAERSEKLDPRSHRAYSGTILALSGLGIAVLGACISFFVKEQYAFGYGIAATGVGIGVVGLIVHFIIMLRLASERRDDA